VDEGAIRRWVVKTPQQRFRDLLREEFGLAPRLANEILAEAENCLLGAGQTVSIGRMRVILTSLQARAGRPLRQADRVEVVWTIDNGGEDAAILAAHGAEALRQARLLRLLDEAIEQGAVATCEDVARALQVSVRTIKRDAAGLRQAGLLLPMRGSLRGIGRGQTHKAVIVGRWLEGQTYDQLAQSCRHAPTSIRRYVEAFIRVVWLARQGYRREEIARLLAIGPALVDEYLAVYRKYGGQQYAARLEGNLERICGSPGKVGAEAAASSEAEKGALA